MLEQAGVSWRIYQDPNDNWTGAMHGCLAFDSFRTASPDSRIYRNGMSHWSLDQLAEHVATGTLPAVSWVLPPKAWSEHPSASSPIQMALMIIWLALANAVALALFGIDKAWARSGGPRIPERTLLLLAYAGGAAGALVGQQLFRHKTRSQPFASLLILSWLSYAGLLAYLLR